MNIATKYTDAHTKNYHVVQIIIVVVPGAPGRLPQIVSNVVSVYRYSKRGVIVLGLIE